jgi:hypothetical protein
LTASDRIVNGRHRQLRYVAGGLIAASAAVGLLAIGVRAGWGGVLARALEATTLLLAAAAYVGHVLAHHETTRELLTHTIRVSAFALWGWRRSRQGCPAPPCSMTL